jgi:hypothetical protein
MKLQHLIVISSLLTGSDVGDPQSALAAAPLASADTAIALHKPIVIAIVVDQLASWVLRERIDKLPVGGGFARLRREGKYYQEMAYAHAITETAPGHASLFTGKLKNKKQETTRG